MVYSSGDDSSNDLPDMKLLLEQALAKGTGAIKVMTTVLPPSLFDSATPPKPKPKPKFQSTEAETTKKHKEARGGLGNSAPRVPKGMEVKRVKKQIKKAVTIEEIVSGTGKKAGGRVEVPSSTVAVLDDSDYASAVENAIKGAEPISRRRRLIQGKYLPRDDEGEDEEDKEQAAMKKSQRPFIDLTGSEEEEEPPRTDRLLSQVASTIPEGDDGDGFILKYSPPHSSKPRKIKKAYTISEKDPTTGDKLSSPIKKAPIIPPSQHRKSSDAFWDQGTTNNWVDTHSPHKTAGGVFWDRRVIEENNGDDILGVDEEEKKLPSTKRTNPKARPKESKKTESKKAFNARKRQLAEEFLETIDDKIGNGEVARKTAATGGVKIIWSKTLRTTAGTARWRVERLYNVPAQTALEHPMSTEGVKHYATIELAEKIVDSPEKLYNILCHEYCHMANYMISYVIKPAHGAEFKHWAAKCSREFAHIGVVVTTKHSYEIDAKFKWTCQTPGCGQIYQRHSKSIDITRAKCGECKIGTLLQTHPPLKEKKAITGYQAFMKENFGRIKAQNPGTPQKDIMKIVAQAYRKSKVIGPEVQKDIIETGEKEGDLEAMLGGLKI